MAATSLLQNPIRLDVDDEWAQGRDSRQKRKMLHKAAPRTYRPRMKNRLSNDALKNLLTDPSNAIMMEKSIEDGRKRNPTSAKTTTASSIIATSPVHTRETSPVPIFPLEQPSLGSIAQATMDDEVDGIDTSHLSQTQCTSDNRQQTHSPPQTQHGLLSPSWHGEEPIKSSQDLILDCLRFQNQLISRLNVQNDPGCFGGFGQGSDDIPSMIEGINQSANSNYLGSSILTTTGMLDDEHKQPDETWRPETTGQRTPQSLRLSKSSSFPSMDGTESLQLKPFLASVSTFPLSGGSVSSISSSMDERLQSVIRYAEAAGFDCFDDLVLAYYLNDFENSPFLANEQHLSRKRRLPNVISDIFQAASYWTNWERHGFYEEVLKAAESVLRSEAAASREGLLLKALSLIDPASCSGHTEKAHILKELKTFTQNNLPNLWALIMGLVSNTALAWQSGRSDQALAMTLLLQLSGGVTNDQLLQLATTCLTSDFIL